MTSCGDACGRTLVSRLEWKRLPPAARVGKGQHEAGGLCKPCYGKRLRRGESVPTARYLRANLLADIAELRQMEPTITRRGLAVRLGLKLKTLETALLRAKKAGHAEAATILTEVRR